MNQEQWEQLEAEANPADNDTEKRLRALQNLAEVRRPDPRVEEQYTRLRNELSAQLKEEGPRYYIDSSGTKRYAYVVAPEKVEVDLEALERLVAQGKLPRVNLDKVAPRKIDPEQFRREVQAGRIPSTVVAQIATITPGTAHVRFADPRDDI